MTYHVLQNCPREFCEAIVIHIAGIVAAHCASGVVCCYNLWQYQRPGFDPGPRAIPASWGACLPALVIAGAQSCINARCALTLCIVAALPSGQIIKDEGLERLGRWVAATLARESAVRTCPADETVISGWRKFVTELKD